MMIRDKRMQSIHSIETYAYGASKDYGKWERRD